MSSPFLFFFIIDTAPTEIYTLSLHDALPICSSRARMTHHVEKYMHPSRAARFLKRIWSPASWASRARSEEHTSELQSLRHLVCRLLLEKKKKKECYLTRSK